jgi:TRAP transporter TAXI family solute receptor
VDARLILNAFGLRERRDLKAQYLNSETAALRLVAGKLDAFIAVAGYPMASVQLALEKSDAQILPLTGKPIEQLLAKYKFFNRDTIPSGVYGNAEPITTISVNALWIVPETADEELIYQITKAIWNEKSRKLLDEGHSKGKMIKLSTALKGVSVPLHPGAWRFYREVNIAE